MKKILIATDGSPSSAEAVELGVELAAEQSASVTFVHVAPALDVLPAAGYGIGGGGTQILHQLDAYDRAPLDAAEEVAERAGVKATSTLLLGNAVDEIVAHADSQDADLIVVGSRGHGTVTSLLLGSVSRGVLSESKRPVVVVRGSRPGATELNTAASALATTRQSRLVLDKLPAEFAPRCRGNVTPLARRLRPRSPSISQTNEGANHEQ